MKTRLLVSTVALLSVGLVMEASAQDRRTVEAALGHLGEGSLTRPSLFAFEGCPQADATGRAIFEAVRSLDVDARTLVQLAIAFSFDGAYPDCDYAPLNEWMVESFRRLHRTGETGPATSFARSISSVRRDLSDAFMEAAADPAFAGDGPRGVLADAAVFGLADESSQVEVAVAGFGSDVPRSWVANTSRRLARSRGADFFREVSGEATEMSDPIMFTIADVLRTDIVDGILEPDSEGLDLIRRSVETRQEVPQSARIPRPGGR